MNEPLTITDEARDAARKERSDSLNEKFDEGHFTQLAINAAMEKATRELKEEVVNQSFVIGELENQLTQWKAVAEDQHDWMCRVNPSSGFGMRDGLRKQEIDTAYNQLASETKGEK